jgi:hypothetical protein
MFTSGRREENSTESKEEKRRRGEKSNALLAFLYAYVVKD